MKIHWLEQTEAAVPGECGWLASSEQEQLEGLRFGKRRRDWRLGRWTAKHAVAACLRLPTDHFSLARIEVRASACGAPEVFFAGKRAPVIISLSHSAGVAVCAIALSYGALGCDVETIEPRSQAFVDDYFTPEEQEVVAQATGERRPLLLALLWSAKESALKALRTGLRLDTRSVIVTIDGTARSEDKQENASEHADQRVDTFNGWRPLRVRHIAGPTFHGWWQHARNLVRTMVAVPVPAPPVSLTPPAGSTRFA